MSGFNTSTRTGDMSMKLRAQNMRNARDQTKRLEEDNRKMEDRLRELKTVMTREKEERERQGGGFWGRGQTQAGSLTKYADEVLNSKTERPPKEGKKKKIKVLTDEPIEVPKRSAQPGTMKYIAQRKLPQGPGPVPKDKQKGPRCGQCEDRGATLSCVQCSEIYCPGCFAAFHVKGALKQHRSVPISASGPRVCMSPHPSLEPQQSPRGSQASGSVVSQSASYGEGSGASSARQPPTPVGAVSASGGVGGGSLLDGAYNESQSAASFQAALMAWRGETPSSSPSSSSSSSPTKDGERDKTARSGAPRKVVVASPVKSPVIAVDESTGTPQEARVPEIKFTSTLSYAERLLLKGHRRTELAEVSTPRLGNQSPPRSGAGDQSQQIVSSSRRRAGYHSDRWEERSSRPVSSSSRSSDFFSRREQFTDTGISRQGASREQTFIDDGERVDFQSLLEAVTSSESPDQLSARRSHSSTSSVSITEIKSTYPSEAPKFKSSTTYVVEEAKPMEAWKIQQHNQISSATFVKDKAGSSSFPSSSSKHPQTKNAISDMFPTTENNSVFESSTEPLRATSSDTLAARLKSAQKKNIGKPLDESEIQGEYETQTLSSGDVDATESKKAGKPSRPKSGMLSRPKSRVQSSRPGSRAQSRAGSRMKVEGLLTKTPSAALSQVAQMAQSSEHTYTYQSPLEDFFLAGVEGQPPQLPGEDRVLTPSKGRPSSSAARPKSRADGAVSAREEKFKVSYKLYKMAPKSWRPDSSLGDAVPLDEVKVDEPSEEMVMTYSYSGQMSGLATEWRPASSHGGFPSDNLGLSSSLVFGDEMFTEDASAAAASASTTATPTPGSFSRAGRRSQNSGYRAVTPSAASNIHHRQQQQQYQQLEGSQARGASRQSENMEGDEEGDITPTPSRAARRKSANRRSFTPASPDNLDSMYNATNKANMPAMGGKREKSSLEVNTSRAEEDAGRVSSSADVLRRSANLRRGIGGNNSRAHSKGTFSPLPSKAIAPTPPPEKPTFSSPPEADTAPPSSSSPLPSASAASARSTRGVVSARSAQLSRRGLRTSGEHNTPPPSSGSATPTSSHRLSSASASGDHDGTPRASHHLTSASKDGRHSTINTAERALSSKSRSAISNAATSLSRQGTDASSSGLMRHASDISSRSQPRQPHLRPASTSSKAATSQRNQTPSKQWRPNSSTGGADPAHRADVSLSASVEGSGHLRKDTVISDMLHSRVQADGWVEGDYDNEDDDGDMVGMSHNYDDGNELDLMSLLSKQRGRGDNNALTGSSQNWETEVRPFSSGRSSIASSRVDNSSWGAGAGDGNLASEKKGTSHRSRPSSSRPLSSLSQASGRESRMIVMDGEDLSMYDNVDAAPTEEDQDTEDRETLEKLEWELASDTGRLTADGQISRMSILENDDDVASSSSSRSSARSLRKSAEGNYDVSAKLLADEQHAHEEVDELDLRRSVTLDEDEVKALG